MLNQILTGRSDVLAERIVSGPVPAFSDLELELDDSGTARVWRIKTAVPTWPDIDMKAARIFLARSGRASFMAEYFINGVPQAAPMTQEERITALTSPGYTYDELLEKSPFEHGLLPHQEMAYWFARDRARKLAGKTGIQEFTEWGDPIED